MNNGAEVSVHSEIHLAFPTPIMVGRLDRDFTVKELAFIQEQGKHLVKNYGNKASVNSHVLDSPELKELKEYANLFVNAYVQTVYKPKEPIEVYITQSWLNYTDKGEYHHTHTHSNSFLSGVLYIEADRDKDSIMLYKTLHNYIALDPSQCDELNGDTWLRMVGTTDIVLFPSNVPHSVGKVTSDKTRVSLAFNTFLRGTLGKESEYTELKL